MWLSTVAPYLLDACCRTEVINHLVVLSSIFTWRIAWTSWVCVYFHLFHCARRTLHSVSLFSTEKTYQNYSFLSICLNSYAFTFYGIAKETRQIEITWFYSGWYETKAYGCVFRNTMSQLSYKNAVWVELYVWHAACVSTHG